MHEASLMRDVMARIQRLAEAEGAHRVTGLSVWLGALSHMSALKYLDLRFKGFPQGRGRACISENRPPSGGHRCRLPLFHPLCRLTDKHPPQ